MSALPLPSLEAQAARYRELDESSTARRLRLQLESIVCEARAHGLRIEVTQASIGHRMGCTTEHVTVTPSRDGYQSTP